MSLQDLAGSPFAIPFDALPPDIQEAIMWLNDQDDLRDLGATEIPTYQEWQEMRRG